MDVRKIMARLHPPSVGIPQGKPSRGARQNRVAEAIALREGFQGLAGPGRVAGSTQSRGGRNPDAMRPEDIAGALAIAGNGVGMRAVLAREVFVHRWWPEGALLTQMRLRRDLYVHVLLPEIQRREQAITAAKLDLHIAEVDVAHRLADGPAKRVVESAKTALEIATARRWPKVDDAYVSLLSTALLELARSPLCETCGGHGYVLMEKPAECPTCAGACVEPMSERRRAINCKLSRAGFQKVWAGVYSWIMRELVALDSEFFRLFAAALDARGGRD